MKLKIAMLLCSFMIFGCSKNGLQDSEVEIVENAQQIGDVMASIDESGGSTGLIAYHKSVEKTFARLAPGTFEDISMAQLILPKAQAAACGSTGFAACNGSGQIIRSFNNCTVGAATFSGDVTLTWSNGSTCTMASNGQFVSREPNFTVTGRRNATLTVSKTGTNGQRLTRTGAGVFNYSNDGTSRVFTLGATTLFDQTTTTTSPVTITGGARANRVISGGNIRVTNNLTSVTCNYVPTSVTWGASGTCNCPETGSWAGSCSNGKSTTLSITGCGTANYTEGSDTTAVTFDRCGT